MAASITPVNDQASWISRCSTPAKVNPPNSIEDNSRDTRTLSVEHLTSSAMVTTIQSGSLPRQTDVLIIGSGITAASVSHHLLATENSISIVVAEPRTITSGGTGRNGGHIIELPYEDYDFQVSMLGRSATKEIVQFRLDHLAEMVEISETQMTEKAAKESEVRVVEAADAVFDQAQWNKVKRQVASFLEDFPEQKTKWEILENDEAKKVFTSTFTRSRPNNVLTMATHRSL